MSTVRNSKFIDNSQVNDIDTGGNYAYNKDMALLYLAAGGVTWNAVRCDVRESHDRTTAALLRLPQLSKTHENKELCCIYGKNKRCSVYSVYSVFIVPTGSLRLPWLRFLRAFSSVVRQMPQYILQSWGTARTLHS